MGGDDLAQIGINQTLHDIAYGFLQHGFHRSTLRLKQAGVSYFIHFQSVQTYRVCAQVL
jgi:hypothetical protein